MAASQWKCKTLVDKRPLLLKGSHFRCDDSLEFYKPRTGVISPATELVFRVYNLSNFKFEICGALAC